MVKQKRKSNRNYISPSPMLRMDSMEDTAFHQGQGWFRSVSYTHLTLPTTTRV